MIAGKINDAESLALLPGGSVILDSREHAWQSGQQGLLWFRPGWNGIDSDRMQREGFLPARLLWAADDDFVSGRGCGRGCDCDCDSYREHWIAVASKAIEQRDAVEVDR